MLFDAVPNVRGSLMRERFQRQAQVLRRYNLVLYLCLLLLRINNYVEFLIEIL